MGLLVAAAVVLALPACGGGGGGGGFHIRDVNRDGVIVIIAFGDSITRGTGDGPDRRSLPAPEVAGYPARLQNLIRVSVRNQGNPGEQTDDGVVRLRGVLEANPDTDYVILLEGINDLLNRHSPDEVITNLGTMVNDVFGAGAMPILGTLTPLCCDHAAVVSNPTVASVNDSIHGLAEEDEVPVVDFFEGFGGLAFDPASGLLHTPEGLHPTPAGYDQMAATAADALL